MNALLRRAGRALLAVVHDKDVQRAGKGLVGLVAIRLLLALGATPTIVALGESILRSLGLI